MTPGADFWELLVILPASPLVIFLIHAILSRMVPIRSRQMVAALAVVCASVPLAVVLRATALMMGTGFRSAASLWGYVVIVYVAIGYTYFHFFNMSETARRIRILCEIGRAGSLTEEKLAALYKTSDIIDVRLTRLIETGQLDLTNGRYSIKGRLLVIAGHSVLFWRKLLKMNDET